MEGIGFQDAVYQLKSSRQLDLIIRKGAAINFVKEKNNQTNIRVNTNNNKHVNGSPAHNKSQEEQSGKLEEEKIKLEQSKIDLDRKRLELEQEKLKQKSEDLENEKKQFEDEKRRTLLTLKKSKSHDPSVPLRINYSTPSEDSDTPSATS